MSSAPLSVEDLDYDLPAELVAQHPAPDRGGSRLMVLQAGQNDPLTIGRFDATFLEQLREDDLVVANDARVLHARVRIRRETGGVGELLLLAPEAENGGGDAQTCRWSAMARPARKYREDTVVRTVAGDAPMRMVTRSGAQTWIVELPCPLADVPTWLRTHGELPLPPYVTERGQDEARYQTVHARVDGSVAAPTAGLHFDAAMWQAIDVRCEVAHLTLHVGAGTFLPIAEGTLDAHPMHHERFEIPATTDAAIRRALAAGRRVVAIGTTTCRVLEHAYHDGVATPPFGAHGLSGSTDLFIRPGHRWGCVGALLTNFHLPRSTLIALVMAFHGIEPTRAAYARAVAEQMRFYSFGDAMFLHGPPAKIDA